MAARFYVYHLVDGVGDIQYIGKGSGKRLVSQKSKHQLFGYVAERFNSERQAYKAEIEHIARHNPPLNKHPGGNGSKASRKIERKPSWQIEMERVGTRVYAARALLCFDLSHYLDASKIEAIRQVADGTRR